MAATRLINIFWRGDGSVLYDETWGSGTLPTVPRAQERSGQEAHVTPSAHSSCMNKSDGTEIVSGRTIWSLVQVFIQFAREVDGGSVQRLIFRDPVEPVGNRRVFGSNIAGVALCRPVLIHVANDALFVVTVTEALSAETSQLRRLSDDFPAKLFVQEVLLYVAHQQASFTNNAVQTTQTAPGPARRADISAAATSAPSNAVGGGAATSRAEMQRSYVSDTSESSFASHPSLTLSQGSYTSSADDPHTSDETPLAPMMPFDATTLQGEIRRIADTLTLAGLRE